MKKYLLLIIPFLLTGCIGTDGTLVKTCTKDEYSSSMKEVKEYTKSLIPNNISAFNNDAGYITGMTILSYGNSTWAEFLAAYKFVILNKYLSPLLLT